ncbi:hypothetical protein ARMGADRAFT_1084804 [Armillaria gallica]|uniref:Uncharacterized protein n=1 Tax=Armillaria gallica TaxID=47427 RepID=A0A2H3CYV5_ARMGA|nr:hypothetical protein ARMGADRAFT_1084804 [Armillaria gallica]
MHRSSYLKIILHADLVSADILHSTMLVEWAGWDTCKVNCTEVNFFVNTNLSPSDDRHGDRPASNNRPADPIFILNATAEADPLNNFATFRMELNIYPVWNYFHKDLLISHGTLADYPFDSYESLIVVFAQEALTNKPVSLVLNSASRLIATSLSNLKITTNNIGSDPIYLASKNLTEEIIHASVTLQRSAFVIGYCLVIAVTFWMVTVMICLIMITTVLFGFRQRNEIVVVPIGTVFAFTQLRSTMPGAPDGFGDVLDFVGLLPCLVLLSICAVTMVGIYLFADPHDPSRKVFTWDELVNVLRFFIRRIWSTANAWAQRGRLRIRIARRKASKVIDIPSANLDC